MSSYSKGYRVETEWRLILEERGHIVTRISGSGSPANPYDLHSTDHTGRSYLWEVKSTSGNVKYFSPDELSRITELQNISEHQGIQSFVVVKFKNRRKGLRQYIVVPPEFVISSRRVRLGDRSLWNL
jgi:Holliday junction resolvase